MMKKGNLPAKIHRTPLKKSEDFLVGGTAGLITWAIDQTKLPGALKAFWEGGMATLEEDKKTAATEFFNFMKEHGDVFTDKLTRDPIFVNGLYKTLELHIRQRNQRRIKIVRAIFLGFAEDTNRETFSLDRLYGTANAISLETVEYLRFVCEIVPPRVAKENKIGTNLALYEQGEFGWALYCTKDWAPVSKYIDEYINEEFDPNSAKVKERYGYTPEGDESRVLLDKIYGIKDVEVTRGKEAMAELVSLGICQTGVSGGGGLGGGGGTQHIALTNYGVEFIKYLSKSDGL